MTARYPFEVPDRRRARPTLLSVGKWVVIITCLVVFAILLALQLAGVRLP